MDTLRTLSALVLISVAGCSSFTPGAAPVPKPSSMPVWRVEGFVGVGADPYVQAERQNAVFDAELNEVGVLPIQVFIQNHGDRPVVIRSSDMRLVLPSGRTVDPSGATEVVVKMEKHPVLFRFGSAGVGHVFEMRDRRADYLRKKFGDVVLGKEESVHGFVYMIPPRGPFSDVIREATLSVRFVDPENATSFVVNVPLKGLAFATKE